jgi:glycerophosphoryl diester phosphodiesterase
MGNSPLLLGHRGVRGEKSIPENSLKAFDLALAEGCDGFEFDVRLSADAQTVICHDASIHSGIRGLTIADCTAKELQLPTLREILSRYQRRAFFDIELKVAGLEKITADLLRGFPPARGVAVSSFLPECLLTLREMALSIPLGLICETEEQLSGWCKLPVDYVIAHRKLVRQTLISEIKSAGKKIMVWTVNIPADMQRFSRWGADALISDSPKKLVHTLKPAPSS